MALPEALDGEENDRVFVVDPDSEIEDEGSSDEDFAAFDGMVPRALRDQLARLLLLQLLLLLPLPSLPHYYPASYL